MSRGNAPTIATRALAPALLVALVAGCAHAPLVRETAGGPTDPATDAIHERRINAAMDRDLVLEFVADHRRQASDAWRLRLTEAIVDEAREAGVDPLLVASIVAHESSFRSRAVSRAGAVGLMQLRPFVARDVASRTGVEWRGRETLHDPALNVRLGVRYYTELLERFDDDQLLALAAYNAGPTRVGARVRRGTFRGSRYAERILATYDRLGETRTTRRAAAPVLRDAAISG